MARRQWNLTVSETDHAGVATYDVIRIVTWHEFPDDKELRALLCPVKSADGTRSTRTIAEQVYVGAAYDTLIATAGAQEHEAIQDQILIDAQAEGKFGAGSAGSY